MQRRIAPIVGRQGRQAIKRRCDGDDLIRRLEGGVVGINLPALKEPLLLEPPVGRDGPYQIAVGLGELALLRAGDRRIGRRLNPGVGQASRRVKITDRCRNATAQKHGLDAFNAGQLRKSAVGISQLQQRLSAQQWRIGVVGL